MNLHRLFRTSAVRLALRYALFYAALVALALGLLYWSTDRFVDSQLAAGLRSTVDTLERAYGELDASEFRALLKAELRAGRPSRLHVLLTDADGHPLAGDLKGWPEGLSTDDRVQNVLIDDDLIPGRPEDLDAYWPALGRRLPDGHRLLVAHGLGQADALLDFTQNTMAAILAVSVALALGLGLLQGRALLLRIDALIDAARVIGAGRLSRRIPLSGQGDEFDELAAQLNAMLDRIGALMVGMRQVTDNVAHDLRRPLSRVRNLLDVTSMEARDTQAYRDAIGHAILDLDEIIHTFNALMEIAQAEAGSFRGEWGAVDLSAIAAELGGLYADLAEEQGRILELVLPSGLTVTGNRHLLAQAIGNLLDNALKFTPAGSPLCLELVRAADRVRVVVSDRGPGIPAVEREHVLKRFVRLDTARSTPGSGLGLSLVAAVARLHGAGLVLGDAEPGLIVSLDFQGTYQQSVRG
jgi:signal transduction histidine kinase